MKNIKRSRKEIVIFLKKCNIFDAAVHHDGKGRQVVVSMPLTAEASQLISQINANKAPGIKCSNGSGLEVKAPNLNYLKNFFRRNLNTNLEPVLD